MDTAIKMKRLAGFSSAFLLALAILFSNAAVAQTSPSDMQPSRGDNDITRKDLQEMDRFLDNHREISEQLRKDPSLIDNRQWVDSHADLREFLQKNPQVREEFKENPNAFMRAENRYERTEGDRDRDHDRDHDITRKDLTEMDRFLDNHREISEQLRKDPSLIDNRQWVDSHADLREFLQKNPQVREEFKENPNAFMRAEERYDRHDGDRDHDWDRDHNARMSGGDRDDHNRGEFTNFGQFLGSHSNMATELSNDPSLATNKEYLATHPELDEYLKAHPMMSQQLTANPQAVMGSTWVQQGSGMGTKQPSTPKDMPKEKPPNQ